MKKTVAALVMLLVALGCTGCQLLPDIDSPSFAYPLATLESTQGPTATPTPNQPDSQAFDFTYQPYLLPSWKRSLLSDEEFAAYQRVVDAIRQGKGQVAVPSGGLMARIVAILKENFPPYALVDSITYDAPNTVAHITYQNDTDKHLRLLQAFDFTVKNIISRCLRQGDSPALRAMELYRYIASQVVYREGSTSASYDALITDQGDDAAISHALEFLLLQVGIDCTHVSAQDARGENREWTVAQINGRDYHLDAAMESLSTGGNGLDFFAKTDGERENDGLAAPYRISVTAFESRLAPVCSHTQFVFLRGYTHWIADRRQGQLILIRADESSVAYPLDGLNGAGAPPS
nr:hypothetical protein [bacterium]